MYYILPFVFIGITWLHSRQNVLTIQCLQTSERQDIATLANLFLQSLQNGPVCTWHLDPAKNDEHIILHFVKIKHLFEHQTKSFIYIVCIFNSILGVHFIYQEHFIISHL